jgi:hypothetical protein
MSREDTHSGYYPWTRDELEWTGGSYLLGFAAGLLVAGLVWGLRNV